MAAPPSNEIVWPEQGLVVRLSLACASCLLKVICKKSFELFCIFTVSPSLLLKTVEAHVAWDYTWSLCFLNCHKWFCVTVHNRIAKIVKRLVKGFFFSWLPLESMGTFSSASELEFGILSVLVKVRGRKCLTKCGLVAVIPKVNWFYYFFRQLEEKSSWRCWRMAEVIELLAPTEQQETEKCSILNVAYSPWLSRDMSRCP